MVIGSALLAGALRNVEEKSETAAAASLALAGHAREILEHVWQRLDGCGPIGDESAVTHTGMAHGWAGLLYATLIWAEAANTAPPPATARRLSKLASLSLPQGRGIVWPMRAGRERSEVMPGWCHGPAGQVHLWNAAHRILGADEYRSLAIKAAWGTFDSFGGGPSICCGEAGRVLALLSMYRHSGDLEWLHRARDRATRAAAQIGAHADGLANSLFKGELGVALAVRELEHPEDAVHPLFEPM